jgi:hypothetical protein
VLNGLPLEDVKDAELKGSADRERDGHPQGKSVAVTGLIGVGNGPATAAPKPMQKTAARRAPRLPLWENASAMASPIGDNPVSSARTNKRPMMTVPRFGKGLCRTII